MIDKHFTIETNASGNPVFHRVENLAIQIVISEDHSMGRTHVELSGDEASLNRLAEILIGVSKSKGYHVHLDASDSSNLRIRPTAIQLTVSNSESPAPNTASRILPPDWAR